MLTGTILILAVGTDALILYSINIMSCAAVALGSAAAIYCLCAIL